MTIDSFVMDSMGLPLWQEHSEESDQTKFIRDRAFQQDVTCDQGAADDGGIRLCEDLLGNASSSGIGRVALPTD